MRALMRGVAAAGFMAAASGAQAQGVDISGEWNCKHAMEPFSGNAYDNHYWEYTLYAAPNGTFQLQGFYYNNIVGQVPVEARGTYGRRSDLGGAIGFEGTMFRADGSQNPYLLPVNPLDERNMYFQFSGNTHVQNVTCGR